MVRDDSSEVSLVKRRLVYRWLCLIQRLDLICSRCHQTAFWNNNHLAGWYICLVHLKLLLDYVIIDCPLIIQNDVFATIRENALGIFVRWDYYRAHKWNNTTDTLMIWSHSFFQKRAAGNEVLNAIFSRSEIQSGSQAG